MSRLISVAVRKGGPNPEINANLRNALETARYFNMPRENIERAIKRAAGEKEGEKLEEIIFEAYGPGGIAMIIEGITDNRKRSINEIKQILNRFNGKLVGEGGVRWMFERMGCITVDLEKQKEEFQNKEELEMAAIEAGAEDTYWREQELDIYTSLDGLEETKKKLLEKGIVVEAATPDWKPKKRVRLEEKEKESALKLFDALDENDAVEDVYSNLEI